MRILANQSSRLLQKAKRVEEENQRRITGPGPGMHCSTEEDVQRWRLHLEDSCIYQKKAVAVCLSFIIIGRLDAERLFLLVRMLYSIRTAFGTVHLAVTL